MADMDTGLLGGLAEGLKAGIGAYNDQMERKRRIAQYEADQKMKKTMMDLDLMKSGYKMDESGGLLQDQSSPALFKEQAGLLREGIEKDPISGMPVLSKMKQREQKAEIGLKEAQASEALSKVGKNSKMGILTEGQKAVDKDYAKDYNDFTGGGATKAVDAISKLKSLRGEMANDSGMIQSGGGPISGSLPDAFRTQKSIARRDNIVSAANSALKATFGGQLSDGERKALANEFYNDRLSNEENLKIIDRKIEELSHGFQTQKAKAKHYENYGSLSSFKGIGEEDKDIPSFDEWKKMKGHE